MVTNQFKPGTVLLVENGGITVEEPLDDKVEVEFNDSTKRFLVGHRTYVPEKHKTRNNEGKKVTFFGVKPYNPSRLPREAMAWGLTGLLTIGAPLMFLTKPSYATEQKQKREDKRLKRIKQMEKDINKIRKGFGLPPISLTDDKIPYRNLTDVVNEQSLQPPTFYVIDKDGNLFDIHARVTDKKTKELSYEVFIPEGGKVVLYEPQKKGKYKADMIFYDEKGRKLALASNEFDFEKHELDVGSTGTASIGLEHGANIRSSIRFSYRVISGAPEPEQPFIPPKQVEEEEEEIKEEPKPSPVPALEKLKKKIVSAEKEKPKEKKTPLIFDVKFGYVFESENSVVEQVDPPRTGKGFLGEGILAGEDYRIWGTFFNLTYDDKQPVYPAGTQIKNVFSQANIGAEYKFLPLTLAVEYIHSNNEWVPVTTPLYSPYMNKFVNNSFFVGGGLTLGDFNESFIQALGYWGKGSLEEKAHKPGMPYLMDYHIDSESITELFGKIHAQFNIDGKLFLEGTASQGKYDNADKTLDGTRLTYGGKLMISGEVVSEHLKHVHAGFVYNHVDIKDNLIDFKNDMIGPIFRLRF